MPRGGAKSSTTTVTDKGYSYTVPKVKTIKLEAETLVLPTAGDALPARRVPTSGVSAIGGGTPVQGGAGQVDRISVKDGSSLSGKVVGGKVPFASSFGEIEVNMDDVRSFADGKLSLADGTVLKGTFGDKEIEIATSVGKLEVDANEVVEIERSGAPTAKEAPKLHAGQGLLTGRVFDAFGQPLRGVTVRIAGTTFSTETGTDGDYQLAYVPGYMVVQLTRAGYESIEFGLNLAQAATYPVENKALVPVKPDPLTAADRRNMCNRQSAGKYNLIGVDNRVKACVETCPPGYFRAEDCRTFHDPKRRPSGTCIRACLPESKR
jgi:hypothetical protein